MITYFDTKILIAGLAILIVSLLFLKHRSKMIIPFTLALLMAAAWCWYFQYEYIGNNTYIFDRLNIYPLTLWTVGLTSLQLVSYEISSRYRIPITILIYLAALFIAEAIGYYMLDIRLNSSYPNLLNLGIIHAPVTGKTFYILAGPAYIILLHLLYRIRIPIPKRMRPSIS